MKLTFGVFLLAAISSSSALASPYSENSVACPDTYKGYYSCVREDWSHNCGVAIINYVGTSEHAYYGVKWSKQTCDDLKAEYGSDEDQCHVWEFPDKHPECIVRERWLLD